MTVTDPAFQPPRMALFRAAAWACVLPMCLGGVGVMVSLTVGGLDAVFYLPVALCFLFGSPIAAWLACRGLNASDRNGATYAWSACATHGVAAATLVHAVAAGLYLLMFLVMGGGWSWDAVGLLLGWSGLIHLGLWLVLTLPFSLLCATIFRAALRVAWRDLMLRPPPSAP